MREGWGRGGAVNVKVKVSVMPTVGIFTYIFVVLACAWTTTYVNNLQLANSKVTDRISFIWIIAVTSLGPFPAIISLRSSSRIITYMYARAAAPSENEPLWYYADSEEDPE